MVTLVTTQEFRFGQENIIPYAGKVKISDKGEIEVEDSIAQKIVESNCGFSFGEKQQSTTTTTTTVMQTTTTTTAAPIVPQTEQDDLGKVQEDELGSKPSEDDLQSNAAATVETVLDQDVARKALEEKNLNELKEMAKPFPSAEWRSKNKEDLITYLLEKINS